MKIKVEINDELGSGLETRPSLLPNAGLGVFSTVDRGINEALCEYKGSVLDELEKRERYDGVLPYVLKHPYFKKENNVLYQQEHSLESCACVDANPFIPGLPIGLGGFVNDLNSRGCFEDSNDSLTYNTIYSPVCNKPLLLICTCREIKAGEELYVDYGDAYWKTRNHAGLQNFYTNHCNDLGKS